MLRYKVTPFVGVWIEIEDTLQFSGLVIVTPFVGVWIEICTMVKVWLTNYQVTPFVGVWIEITESMTKRRKA